MYLRLGVLTPDVQHLRIALAGLTAMNMAVLAGHPEIPPLYTSGVVYRREYPDVWETADIVYGRRYGDCEDLSTWRTAELRRQGENAHADLYRSGPRMWHAIVIRGNGEMEDPSRILGMRGRAPRRR